eukprot:TRINITY_DN17772_c0_g1_i2.p2 TRINITY_DN17772_c0_g1~~TRINITY_DN17772_c0_g1_i2.p2  ORF type:complete len:131 (+),score=16.10 TRINITY_DN17772_c0_g1_i2:473-865(+)
MYSHPPELTMKKVIQIKPTPRILPIEWSLRTFNLSRQDMRDDFSGIVNKIQEMINSPQTQIRLVANLFNYTEDLNYSMPIVAYLLSKVTNLSDLQLKVDLSNLDDEGCLAIRRLLQKSVLISHLTLWMAE